jgi:uncharacterized protein
VTDDSLKLGVGNWVAGERFYNRDRELELLMEILSEGDSVSIVAQRRIGKTSLMREAARRMGTNIVALHVDLQKAQTPEDAIVELSLAAQAYEGVGRKAINIISGVVENTLGRIESLKTTVLSVTLRSNLSEENWQRKGDDLFQMLADVAEQQGKLVIIFFDEVPILLNRLLRTGDGCITSEGKTITDHFMSWLRDNVIRHKGTVTQVITGSIGIEPILGQAGLSGTLNVYRPFELRPWKPATAIDCLLALARHHELPLRGAQAGHMIELLGCPIPHHVQMFFDQVNTAYVVDEMNGDVSDALIDEVYRGAMTGLRGHPELSHMEERLRTAMPGARFTKALGLLTEAATVGSISHGIAIEICRLGPAEANSSPERDVTETLSILVHDGYLRQEGDIFCFESTLLRDWWRRRFGYGYKPVTNSGGPT